MDTFPLRALPFLALKLVIEQADFFDLVFCALLNRCFKRIMKACKYRIETFKMGNDRFIIKTHDVAIEIWRMVNRPETYDTVAIKKKPAFMTFEKTDGKRRFDRNAINIHFPNENNDFLDLERVCEDVMEFLIPQNIEISLDGPINALSNFFAWDKYNKYTRISLSHYFSKPIEISWQRLEFILENLTINHLDLDLIVNNKPQYKYRYGGPARGAVKINYLYIKNSKWVNYVRLFDDFNATTINCMIPTSKMINTILKKWIRGTHEGVEEARLHRGYSECDLCGPRMIRKDILKGIRSTPTTHEMSELNYVKLSWRYCNPLGIDIKRTRDGQKATVWITEFELLMKIWPA